jgi:hypothetical protein
MSSYTIVMGQQVDHHCNHMTLDSSILEYISLLPIKHKTIIYNTPNYVYDMLSVIPS